MAKSKSYSEIQKKYGNKVSTLSEDIEFNETTLRIPSRCLWLNHITGGGLPYGKIMEIFGYESTGKSLLAKDFAAVTQKLGGIVLWADAEQCFDAQWAIKNGLDPDKIVKFDGNMVEEISDWAKDMAYYYRETLPSNVPILLVIDSLAALDSMDNIDVEMSGKKAEMGNRAKKIYEFYRTRNPTLHRLGVSTIIINQVRKKMGASMFESSETTPGGDSTRFYSSIRLGLMLSSLIKGKLKNNGFVEDKKDGKKVGSNVWVKPAKNKTAPPKDNIKTQVYFTEEKTGYVGFNRYMGLDDILQDMDIIKKKGAYFYLDGETIAQGADQFINKLHNDSKLRKKLIKESGINTVSKVRKQLENLGKDLFNG